MEKKITNIWKIGGKIQNNLLDGDKVVGGEDAKGDCCWFAKVIIPELKGEFITDAAVTGKKIKISIVCVISWIFFSKSKQIAESTIYLTMHALLFTSKVKMNIFWNFLSGGGPKGTRSFEKIFKKHWF